MKTRVRYTHVKKDGAVEYTIHNWRTGKHYAFIVRTLSQMSY